MIADQGSSGQPLGPLLVDDEAAPPTARRGPHLLTKGGQASGEKEVEAVCKVGAVVGEVPTKRSSVHDPMIRYCQIIGRFES